MEPQKKESEQGRRSPGFRLLLSIIVISGLIGLVIIAYQLARGRDRTDAVVPGKRYAPSRPLDATGGRALPLRPGRSGAKGIGKEEEPSPGEYPVRPALQEEMRTVPKEKKFTRKDFERYQKTRGDREHFEENVRMDFELNPSLWEGLTPEEKEEKFQEFRESILRLSEESKHNSTQTGMGSGKKRREKNWEGRQKKDRENTRDRGGREQPEAKKGTQGPDFVSPGQGRSE